MDKKKFYIISTIVSVAILAILVYAYGGTDPAVHGHSIGELEGSVLWKMEAKAICRHIAPAANNENYIEGSEETSSGDCSSVCSAAGKSCRGYAYVYGVNSNHGPVAAQDCSVNLNNYPPGVVNIDQATLTTTGYYCCCYT